MSENKYMIPLGRTLTEAIVPLGQPEYTTRMEKFEYEIPSLGFSGTCIEHMVMNCHEGNWSVIALDGV